MSTVTERFPILLASDFPILRESLKAYFDRASSIELVACANDRNEVLPLLKLRQPKLVLLDLNIDWDELCVLLDEIHNVGGVRSLIMSDDLDSTQIIELLRHGAHGVLPRRTSEELFTKSITNVLAGDLWVSRAIIADFVNQLRQDMPAMGSRIRPASSEETNVDISRFNLTPRETQVVLALADGQTNKDIARTFGISEYTVKHHLTSVYDKLGLYNRVELVLFAVTHGLCTNRSALLPARKPEEESDLSNPALTH